MSFLMKYSVLIIFSLAMVCTWFWLTNIKIQQVVTNIQEGFLIDLPNALSNETVDRKSLSHFKTIPDSCLDVEALSSFFDSAGKPSDPSLNTNDDLSQEEAVKDDASPKAAGVYGSFETYSISDISIQDFVKEVVGYQNDYAAMRAKFSGLIMAIVYNPTNNSITYMTLEKPWQLPKAVFEDEKYFLPLKNAKIYLPLWSYGQSDPGLLSIDPECFKVLDDWKNSDDSEMIRQLERNKCLSKENKIRFVGMVLLNYLKILENDRYDFKTACSDWKGLVSNISSPELSDILNQVNNICEEIPIDSTEAIDKDCVKPFNDWAMTSVTLPDACAPAKASFLKRIELFLKIGEHIPVDFFAGFLFSDKQII